MFPPACSLFPLVSGGCPLGTVQWPVFSRLHGFSLTLSLSSTFSGSLNNSRQRAAGLICTLQQCSGISELSSGHGAHYTEPDVEFLLCSRRTSSTQHPAHSRHYAEWDYHYNHILRSQSLADGVGRAVDHWRVISKGGGCDDGGYIDMAAADIMLHLLTLPAESIHHACLWGWSLSLSFIFSPSPSCCFFFSTADKGKRLMKEVTFQSPLSFNSLSLLFGCTW